MTSLLDQLQSAFPSTYALEREVGRGGMATVFLARDVRYDRKVAVKVLSPELGAVLGVERFLSEIRVTATLQHPNLLPLFDSGEANGLLYYVMPFVEGETLRARLEREKQLSVSETVRLGSAIASALDYAHRNGVIHRDLKPENILLQDGQPLVADFGIALAVSNAGGARVTQTGLSLGTPQYMSPEQATGDRVIDARSDVYALGAILYECLTGEPPHTGTTAQAIIARLMTEEPRAISATRKNVPAHVEAAIARALEKLPADRWASTKELADVLQDGSRITSTTVGTPAPDRRGSRARLAVAAIALAILGVEAWRYRGAPTAASDTAPVHFAIGLPTGASLTIMPGLDVVISPDGRSIAFTGQLSDTSEPSLLLRSLDSLAVVAIPGTENAQHPSFSPDGRSLVYKLPGRGFRRVSLSGGSPVPFSTYSGAWTGGAWHFGGGFVFGTATALNRITADGRGLRVIGVAPRGAGLSYPLVLPDGRTVVMRLVRNGASSLGIADTDSGVVLERPLDLTAPLGYAEGRLIFGQSGGTIASVPFDLERREVTGEPTVHLANLSTNGGGGINAALAANGTLVMMRGSVIRRLVLAARDGGTRPLSAEQLNFADPKWSPTGNLLAVVGSPRNERSGSGQLWIIDPASGTQRRVVEEGATQPSWSADGRHVVYAVSGRGGVWMSPVDGSAPPRQLLGPGLAEPRITPDGRHVIGQRELRGGPRRSQIVRVALEDTSRVEVLAEDSVATRLPQISPDGRWLAYFAARTGGQELFVKAATPDAGQLSVATPAARVLRWGADSRTLYFTRNGPGVFRATLSFAGTGISVQRVDSVTALPGRDAADVSPDGARQAFVETVTSGVQLEVITNWTQTLKRLGSAR